MCERLLNLQEIYVSGQNICIVVYGNSVGTITPNSAHILVAAFVVGPDYLTFISALKITLMNVKKLIEKSIECQDHKPKPIPDTKRKRKRQKSASGKGTNKCTRSTFGK